MPSENVPKPGALFQAYGLRTKKRFGQHFLTDPMILKRIVDLGNLTESSKVLEIGPGCGTLTSEILRRTKHVIAAEIDRDAASFLREKLGPLGLEVLEGDVLRADLDEMTFVPSVVIANLPYNVGTKIALQLIRRGDIYRRLVLMFQKEVAERICAEVGSKGYGSLALNVQLYCDAKIEFTLPGGAFTPPPKVMSAVVTLCPLEVPRIEDEALRARFEEVVRSAFKQRRKMISTSLRQLGLTRDELIERIMAAGLDPKSRPETLSFEEFVQLARRL